MKIRRRFWLFASLLGVVAAVVAGGLAVSQASGPPSKAELEGQRQQEVAQAQAHLKPKPAPAAPQFGQAPERQAGIVETHQGPFSALDFTVRNEWQGPQQGSTWYLVFAGAKRNYDAGTATPAVKVWLDTPNARASFDDVDLGTFLDPAADSPFTVVGVAGSTVQLRTDSGRAIKFDLVTHQYS